MSNYAIFYFIPEAYNMFRYAFIVGILISLCSSLLGVTLVLKRFSFIGDGLSHVAFGAMAVAIVTSVTNQMVIILPVTVLFDHRACEYSDVIPLMNKIQDVCSHPEQIMDW